MRRGSLRGRGWMWWDGKGNDGVEGVGPYGGFCGFEYSEVLLTQLIYPSCAEKDVAIQAKSCFFLSDNTIPLPR